MIQDISDSKVNSVHYESDDLDEFTYRSLSRAAVLSVVFAFFGLLAWISPVLLFLAAVGLVFGIIALRN